MAEDETAYHEGPVGDFAPCFELCYGSVDDHDAPSSWLVVARVAFDGSRPIVEQVESPEITDAIRATARREVQRVFSSDYMGTEVMSLDADGQCGPLFAGRIAAITHSTANWYGDWHWRANR